MADPTLRNFEFAAVPLPLNLSATAAAGVEWLLARLATEPAIAGPTAVPMAAYMMATVEHETWRRFTPVAEVGRGQGKPYGVALRTALADGTYRQNTYYGRGYVQLTWQANYLRLGVALGMGRALVESPDLALEPETAYKIMVYGMLNSSFTGRRLQTYINQQGVDYVNARRVINGLDCAEPIAACAKRWQTILS